MKTKLALLAVLALSLSLIASCKSTSDRRQDLPCICGSNEAILDGCPNSRCLAGEGNPDNPDCVCGPLAHEMGDDQ